MIGWRLLLAVLVTGICWLAFWPAPPQEISTGWDKANHWLAFSTLAITACLAFPHARRRHAGVALWLLAYGIFIEAVQSQIPERTAELMDIVADSIGIAAGLLLTMAWQRWRAR